MSEQLYQFGPFMLDERQRTLFRNDEPVKLPLKSFELLTLFVKNPNVVIDKETLMSSVWPETVVEDANLSVQISTLRKALELRDQNGSGHGIRLETLPKVGYRFCADVVAKPRPSETVKHDLQPVTNEASSSLPRKLALSLVVLAAAAGIFAFGFYNYRPGDTGLRFSDKSTAVARSTNVGRVFSARVSPDGKQLVYGRQDSDGTFSIWLKLVGSSSETAVLAPTKGRFYGVRFSPDGQSIVFAAGIGDQPDGSYVMPVYGGSSAKLPLKGAYNVVYSRDGKRLAYLWNELSEGKTHLVVADSDGSNDRSVYFRQAPNYYWTAVDISWSPDGKRVLCVAQNANEGFPRLVEVDVESGTETELTGRTWVSIRGVEWLHDGSGMIIAAAEETSSVFQIWHLSYPGLEPTKITNDAASYFGVSLSNDDRVLVTIERNRQSSIWVAPVTGLEGGLDSIKVDVVNAVKISNSNLDGADTVNGYGGLKWTPDGRIVFTSEEAGNGDIWIMNADGTARTQLTTDRRWDTGPAVSPDGKTVAFMSYRDATESIWLMDINGENQRRVTFDLIERSPTFSPDGKWIYFAGWRTGTGRIWRIPVNGGEMENVVPEVSFSPYISSDGRWLIYNAPGKQVIRDLSGGEADRNIAERGIPRWGPLPKTITLLRSEGPDLANLFIKNLDTGEIRKITDFSDNRVSSFEWSPDGTKLAFVRQNVESDVVVMSAK